MNHQSSQVEYIGVSTLLESLLDYLDEKEGIGLFPSYTYRHAMSGIFIELLISDHIWRRVIRSGLAHLGRLLRIKKSESELFGLIVVTVELEPYRGGKSEEKL